MCACSQQTNVPRSLTLNNTEEPCMPKHLAHQWLQRSHIVTTRKLLIRQIAWKEEMTQQLFHKDTYVFAAGFYNIILFLVMPYSWVISRQFSVSDAPNLGGLRGMHFLQKEYVYRKNSRLTSTTSTESVGGLWIDCCSIHHLHVMHVHMFRRNLLRSYWQVLMWTSIFTQSETIRWPTFHTHWELQCKFPSSYVLIRLQQVHVCIAQCSGILVSI